MGLAVGWSNNLFFGNRTKVRYSAFKALQILYLRSVRERADKSDRSGRSGIRRQTDVAHEQRIDAGLAERHDRIGGRADDRLAVVEGHVDDQRHAGSRV